MLITLINVIPNIAVNSNPKPYILMVHFIIFSSQLKYSNGILKEINIIVNCIRDNFKFDDFTIGVCLNLIKVLMTKTVLILPIMADIMIMKPAMLE